MREDLDPDTGQDLSIPPNRSLLADLCSVRWKLAPNGIQVESKGTNKEDEQWSVRKRLGRSPDEGDALVYANAKVVNKKAIPFRPGKTNRAYNPQRWR